VCPASRLGRTASRRAAPYRRGRRSRPCRSRGRPRRCGPDSDEGAQRFTQCPAASAFAPSDPAAEGGRTMICGQRGRRPVPRRSAHRAGPFPFRPVPVSFRLSLSLVLLLRRSLSCSPPFLPPYKLSCRFAARAAAASAAGAAAAARASAVVRAVGASDHHDDMLRDACAGHSDVQGAPARHVCFKPGGMRASASRSESLRLAAAAALCEPPPPGPGLVNWVCPRIQAILRSSLRRLQGLTRRVKQASTRVGRAGLELDC
jgi:hypothetical protein